MTKVRYSRRMGRLSCLGVVGALAFGCTKANPAASCADGTCSDPAFPFCDAVGVVSGTPNACVAYSCTPGAVDRCEGSSALICNATATGFDTQTCTYGCDGAGGCVACLANQTTCVAGTLSVCDGNGVVSSSTACAVGCSSDATRCATLVPSNDLAAQLAMVANPPDIDLENGGLDVTTGMFTPTDPSDGSAYPVAMIFVDAAAGGQLMEVIVAHKLTLNNVGVGFSSETRPNVALAAIATSDVEIDGTLTIGLIGIDFDEQCIGEDPTSGSDHGFTDTIGGGGGGFGTIGGDGGAIGGGHGGTGGAISGNETLIPLRGGCDGGNIAQRGTRHSFGGGALQLTSLTSIEVRGIVNADASLPAAGVGAGGGTGGAILLEGPSVILDANASLLARGAGGTAGDGTDGVPQQDALSVPGGICKTDTDQVTCSAGGAGASPTVAAPNAAEFDGVTGIANVSTGGGGGGLGRIRINTADGTFTPGSGALVAGALTVGTVATQ
jgi:hypothetical protein